MICLSVSNPTWQKINFREETTSKPLEITQEINEVKFKISELSVVQTARPSGAFQIGTDKLPHEEIWNLCDHTQKAGNSKMTKFLRQQDKDTQIDDREVNSVFFSFLTNLFWL